jgi:hypothetical protein
MEITVSATMYVFTLTAPPLAAVHAHHRHWLRPQGGARGAFCRRHPLRPETVAEGAEGIQEVGDELLLVVVVHFLTHGHKY